MRQLSEILENILEEKKKQNVLLSAIGRKRTTIESMPNEEIEDESLAGILENILLQERRATELLDQLLTAGG